MEKRTPVGRLNYSGSLEPVVVDLCRAYKIGQPTDFSIVEVGYEDCNVIIQTSSGKYLAKIFSKVRTPQNIARYTITMQKVMKAGVNHPALLKTDKGNFVYRDGNANEISMVLTRFVEGKTFLELDRAPNTNELRDVLEQAAKVNSIDYHPPYLFDSWAIPNIQSMFERVREFIQPGDLTLVEQAMSRYAKIPVDALPHCFVHGDFTKANIVKGDDGEIYVLDFSVSNWYPRIQELAVITANLLYDKDDSTSLHDKSKIVAKEYNKFIPLAPEEQRHFYAYTLAGVTMEFMGSHQERYINGNDTAETEYWLNLGREGLRKALL